MAAVTLLGTVTFTTTSGTKTVTATPAVNDLICLVCAHTGSTSSIDPTDDNPDGLGTYTSVIANVKVTNADTMRFYLRNSLVGSATSTIFTHAPGATSGGGIAVLKITGMSRTGAAAKRQNGGENNQAGGTTPAPTFPGAALTTNAIIGAVFNGANPATMTPRSSPAYTERADVGYNTPATGLEIMTIDSGETGSTITWGSSCASAFCDSIIEVDTSAPAAAQGGTLSLMGVG